MLEVVSIETDIDDGKSVDTTKPISEIKEAQNEKMIPKPKQKKKRMIARKLSNVKAAAEKAAEEALRVQVPAVQAE